jgi:hypothetical protein
MAQIILGERGFTFLQIKGNAPLQGEIIAWVKIHWFFFLILLQWLGANHPWVKGIKVCSNIGPGPLQRGDNHKYVKIGWGPQALTSLGGLILRDDRDLVLMLNSTPHWGHRCFVLYMINSSLKFVQIMVPGGWEGPQ